jgi:hypothetical protein
MAEMALAYTIENKAERAYRRGDMFDTRRRLMDDWASYCGKPAVAWRHGDDHFAAPRQEIGMSQ